MPGDSERDADFVPAAALLTGITYGVDVDEFLFNGLGGANRTRDPDQDSNPRRIIKRDVTVGLLDSTSQG